MAVYCFRCRSCGTRWQGDFAGQHCTSPDVVRDYRAESVGIGSGVRVSRDGTKLDQARMVLPTERDFKGPGDPDGTKGMREWHDRFEPRADNPAPVHPGRIERKTF
jgi:hypothetical protein